MPKNSASVARVRCRGRIWPAGPTGQRPRQRERSKVWQAGGVWPIGPARQRYTERAREAAKWGPGVGAVSPELGRTTDVKRVGWIGYRGPVRVSLFFFFFCFCFLFILKSKFWISNFVTNLYSTIWRYDSNMPWWDEFISLRIYFVLANISFSLF